MSNEQTPANNSLAVAPDGIIVLTQRGYQTGASTVQFQAQIDELVRQRRVAKQAALILTDISAITGHDTKVRDLAHDLLQSDFDAMAIVTGGNVTTRLIGNWLAKLAGVGQRVEFFVTKDDGLAWLKTHAA
jgi:hypothetical protein